MHMVPIVRHAIEEAAPGEAAPSEFIMYTTYGGTGYGVCFRSYQVVVHVLLATSQDVRLDMAQEIRLDGGRAVGEQVEVVLGVGVGVEYGGLQGDERLVATIAAHGHGDVHWGVRGVRRIVSCPRLGRRRRGSLVGLV